MMASGFLTAMTWKVLKEEGRSALSIINHSPLSELTYQVISLEQKGYFLRRQ